MRLPSTRTTPKPRLAAPGSIPITTCMGTDSGQLRMPLRRSGKLPRGEAQRHAASGSELLEDLLGMSKLAWTSLTSSCSSSASSRPSRDFGVVALDLDRALRLHRHLGGLDLDARRLERLAHRAEVAGLAEHPQQVAVLAHVLGAGVDRGDQVVLAVAARRRRRRRRASRRSRRPSPARRGCRRAW